MIFSNISKTINYCKKNGIKEGYYAVKERLWQKRKYQYEYEEVSQEVLDEQAKHSFKFSPLISILVPAYETKPIFIEDLILSLEEQSYSNFQLIIADASESDSVERMTKELNKQYHNIEYVHLDENLGISENSNKALEYVKGDYVALLDHDDTMTPDALYEMVDIINKQKGKNLDSVLIFSDEDKATEYMDCFYEPNIKGKFNKEMLFTNNYVCHLSVYKTSVIKELRFRKEYDGAQDFDLVLRTLAYVEENFGKNKINDYIINVPKVLYHWRCHTSSTAANPQAKMYAYDAGKRAVEDYFSGKGINVTVSHSKHLGFYRVDYPDGIFNSREEIGIVGGPVYKKNIIAGGAMDAKGNVIYEGLDCHFSGILNRASLCQQVQAIDLRNMIIRPELESLLIKTIGSDLEKLLKQNDEKKIVENSIIFCNKIRNMGITILYDPMLRNDSNES